MHFNDHERRLLVAAPRLGPAVVQRLEAIGLTSFDALRRVGVDEAVQRICRQMGSPAWANRRRALQRLLAHAQAGTQGVA